MGHIGSKVSVCPMMAFFGKNDYFCLPILSVPHQAATCHKNWPNLGPNTNLPQERIFFGK